MVTKKLRQEIIPVWTALVLESDNGPVLMAKVSQNSTKVLNSNWKLHCVCRPPGSGQIEMTNGTLRETGQIDPGNWPKTGPTSSLFPAQARCASPWRELPPFEMMLAQPVPSSPNSEIFPRQKCVISPFAGPCRLCGKLINHCLYCEGNPVLSTAEPAHLSHLGDLL